MGGGGKRGKIWDGFMKRRTGWWMGIDQEISFRHHRSQWKERLEAPLLQIFGPWLFLTGTAARSPPNPEDKSLPGT